MLYPMLSLKTCLMAVTLSLVSAVSAQAVTLASFSITNGTYIIDDNDEVMLTGNFEWDASGYHTALAMAPNTPLPVVFDTTFILDGISDVSGYVGPVDATPIELVSGAFGIGAFVAAIVDQTDGVTPAPVYLRDGFGRTDPLDVFDLGPADLFFTYTGRSTGPTSGPTSGEGTFQAILTRTAPSGMSLTDMLNNALNDLDLLGNTFGANETGTFQVTVDVAAVPLPSGLPLLLAGLLGLIAVRRRGRVA